MRPPYQQRDLIQIKDSITLPEEIDIKHPFLILSPDDVNRKERHYVCVMMTGMERTDTFSFQVSHDMFEAHLGKNNCQFRIHLVVSVREQDIMKHVNVMRESAFKHLIRQVKEVVFRYP